MRFYKYHGLGNDYIVMDPRDINRDLTRNEIVQICHRNYGMGSDGILWGPIETADADFQLRIFNPDGSEAEKSGNGLRIFARYLYDQRLVQHKPFKINTLGGMVEAKVHRGGGMVDVEMGHVNFHSDVIPVEGPSREVINETLTIHEKEYTYCAVTIGNPHCVLPMDNISEKLAREIGPVIETEARFTNRTNVQLLKVLDRNNIQIEIWERGAGYTLASGSSSSAAASVAYKLGLCDQNITVHMPGGVLDIHISEDYSIHMTGPVTQVGEGEMYDELFSVDVI